MSGKVNDAILQRLVAQGYTKSKATKALKECRNNEQQALALLKRESAPATTNAPNGVKPPAAGQYVQLGNEDRDDPLLGPTSTGSSSGGNQGKGKKPTLFDQSEQRRGQGKGSGDVGTHPCVVRYGYCRYGKHCAFKDLPGNMCLNYLLGNCIYGDLCRSYHTLNGKDVRTVLGLKTEKEYIQLEDGSVVEISKTGKVHEGEIIGVIPKEEPREQKIPQPADWSAHAASQPSHSDPLAPIPMASAGGSYYPSSSASYAPLTQTPPLASGPSPFLEKLKAGLKEPQPATSPSSSSSTGGKHSAKSKDRLNLSHNASTGPSALNPSATPFFMGNLSKLRNAASGGAATSTPLTKLVSKRTEVDTATTFPRDPNNPWYGMPIPVHPCLVQKGSCLFGDHCLYMRVPGDICVYWLNGLCHFADEDCYWRHEEPPEDTLNQDGFMDLEMMAQDQLLDEHQQQWMVQGDGAQEDASHRTQADPGTSFWGLNPEGVEGADLPPENYRPMPSTLPGLPGSMSPTAVNDAALLGPTTSSTGFSQGQLGIVGDVDTEKEERAFAAMRQVFPDTPPTTLIHCLRLANYDRHRVANFILQSESDNLTSEQMEAKFLAENLQEEKLLSRPQAAPTTSASAAPPAATAAVPAKGGPTSSPDIVPTGEGSALAQAVAKSLKVVLLCQLFPTLEPSTVESALQSTDYKFGDAFTLLEGSHELKILSDSTNSWRTDLTTALSGGSTTAATAGVGLTMAEKLLLETIGKQFPQLPAPVIRSAFLENGKDMNKTVSALTPVNNDQMELREHDGSNGQGKGRREQTKERPKPATQRNSTSMTVTASTSSSNQESEVYRQAAEELDAHGDWRRTREEAYLTNDVRIRCLQLATAAYQRGDGRLAKTLSQRAYEYGQEYYRLNRLAMKALEEEQSVHGTSTLDLHGFHVEEALEVLSRRVQLCQQRHITRLKVIVGEGNHSRGGKGRGLIFPALLESLRTRGTNLNRCCTIISIRKAMLFLKIHLEENWR